MGSVPAELSLDFRTMSAKFVPKTIGDFLQNASPATIADAPEKAPRVESLLRELQEEMKKIDAFKRELPLCMLLLNDAIVVVKESVQRCATSKQPPVLEEFIPLKKSCEEDEDERRENTRIKNDKDSSSKDKKSWMSSVQLWSSDDQATPASFDAKRNLSLESSKVNKKVNRCGNEDAFFSVCKNRGLVTLPVKNFPSLLTRKEDNGRGDDLGVPGLSLLTPGIKNSSEDSGSTGSRATSSAPNSQSNNSHKGGPHSPFQASRKQRRCWSPELHRRFVNALQQLGGSQAATPKQIREIMQVDGLTNDEVKSHLQKYRLHTRRMAPGGNTPANQSVVVLGGLWMSSQEQYGDSSKAASSQSGSPQGPLQFGGTLTGGDSMEDDDDAKSENYSWKSHTPRSGKVGV
ncbi:unnamed protein product [Linum tenue]|uniref:HTH myb-type domain-containing protein n=2 Tax=Linum tenue TaxID=586396 RepID=A0AAV0ML65_9ROSI|nr:unnamed protein product [Linum tenue]